MDYYANAAWADRAPALVQDALVDAFDKSGKIAAVAARHRKGVRGDYRLEIGAAAISPPITTCRTAFPPSPCASWPSWWPRSDRQIVASLDSVHTEQASANSVPAVVEAFDTALGASLEEIAGWALKASPPASGIGGPCCNKRHGASE